MLNTLKSAFKSKDVRKKLMFTFLMILIVRLGSQVPVPGIDREYFTQWFASQTDGAFNMLSAFTGGSFERFSVFALSITPFITASIIVQLMGIVIPSLEALHRDGKDGQKKIEKITRIVAVSLALLESAAMAIGFGRSGLLPGMTVLRGFLVVLCLTLGSALLIMIGDFITKKGIGNGISIILLVNILSRVPSDISSLFEMFVQGKSIAPAIFASVVIVGVILITIVLVVILGDAQIKIPVTYSRKMAGSQMMGGGQSSFIPMQLNPAGVVPVIFASSMLSIPQIIASMAGKGYGSGISKFILNCINQNNWFSRQGFIYTVGLIGYIAMVLFFAYFYTSITFNPVEIADSIKKQGGVIPGIRQGKPTEQYIAKHLKYTTFIGTIGLILIMLIPIFFNGMFGASVSFGGTSIIIIVGVILETLKQLEAETASHVYRSFLK